MKSHKESHGKEQPKHGGPEGEVTTWRPGKDILEILYILPSMACLSTPSPLYGLFIFPLSLSLVKAGRWFGWGGWVGWEGWGLGEGPVWPNWEREPPGLHGFQAGVYTPPHPPPPPTPHTPTLRPLRKVHKFLIDSTLLKKYLTFQWLFTDRDCYVDQLSLKCQLKLY